MVGIELASKLATIKWQKKLQFTITQYNTEQNNIIQIFEVSLMPIIGRAYIRLGQYKTENDTIAQPIDRFIGGIATTIKGQESVV